MNNLPPTLRAFRNASMKPKTILVHIQHMTPGARYTVMGTQVGHRRAASACWDAFNLIFTRDESVLLAPGWYELVDGVLTLGRSYKQLAKRAYRRCLSTAVVFGSRALAKSRPLDSRFWQSITDKERHGKATVTPCVTHNGSTVYPAILA